MGKQNALVEKLKDTIYPLAPPSRTREKPMQILAVGPSRSGTASLRAALIELGYTTVYHGFEIALHPEDDRGWYNLMCKKWRGTTDKTARAGDNTNAITAEEFDSIIGHCVAITDQPAASFAPELIAAYPDAKVILNVRRDVEAWHQSVMHTIMPFIGDTRAWARSWFCTELFWAQQNFVQGSWPAFFRGDFADNGKWVLREHCATIRGLVPREKLLEWDVSDGWEPLCRFLEKEVPDRPFPRGNTKSQHDNKIEDYYAARNERADRRMLIAIFGMLLFWLVGMVAYWFGSLGSCLNTWSTCEG